MTIEEIKNNPYLLCGMNIKDFNVKVYLIFTGTEKVQYYFFYNDKLIFQGNDFRPSPMHDKYSIDSIVSLLGFLTLKKGDTDKEYFKDYTSDQWNWSESFDCEQLAGFVSDFDMKDSEYYKDAEKFFKESYFIPD
jgi:hypothetical protein